MKLLLSIMLYLLPLSYCFAVESSTYTVPLTDKKGIEMFLQSEYRDSYWPLSQYYEQQRKRYCGIASAVMVLNALDIPRPKIWEGSTSTLFTQDNFFSDAVCKQIKKEAVDAKGVTLAELSQTIKAHGVHAETVYANTLTVESFRELLKRYLVETDRFVIANYSRDIIQKQGGGHISPIAAYDQQTDSVLILDVFRCKYTGTWVDLSQFFIAMQGIDSDSGMHRGLVLVRRPT